MEIDCLRVVPVGFIEGKCDRVITVAQQAINKIGVAITIDIIGELHARRCPGGHPDNCTVFRLAG